jgi:hypothetical protein
MSESTLTTSQAQTPIKRTSTSFFENKFGWFDDYSETSPRMASLILILVISFVFIILPLAALAYIKDILSAFNDVNNSVLKYLPLAYVLIILTWFAGSVFSAIVYWRQLALVYKMMMLRQWCSKRGCSVIANTIAAKSRRIVWSWTRYLDRAITPDNSQPRVAIVAYDALIAAYLEGLATIRSGESLRGSDKSFTEAEGPLLPSNFLLYARCVEQIRKMTAAKYGASPLIKISVRTLLTRDIKRWFNIQRIHLSDDKPVWCTTRWWEEYKKEVRDNSLTQHGICLHRLLRYDPPKEGTEPEIQRQYFRLGFRKEMDTEREFLTAQEFIEVKSELSARGLSAGVVWLDGAEFIDGTSGQGVSQVVLHPICQVSDSEVANQLQQWTNDRFVFSSAFWNYKHYHNSTEEIPQRPVKPGAWGKQIGQGSITPDAEHLIRNNDDLFLVDFFDRNDAARVVGRFGISFRIEELKDIAGIRLLSDEEASNAVAQFDNVWLRASAL